MKAWQYYEIEAGLMIPFDPDLSFKPGVQVFQSLVPCKDFFLPMWELSSVFCNP